MSEQWIAGQPTEPGCYWAWMPCSRDVVYVQVRRRKGSVEIEYAGHKGTVEIDPRGDALLFRTADADGELELKASVAGDLWITAYMPVVVPSAPPLDAFPDDQRT